MAHLYRKTIVRYLDSETGKQVTKQTPGAMRKKIKSGKYRGRYLDANGVEQDVSLSSNKIAAQQMLNELVKKAELGRAGVVDPFEQHHKRPLSEHLTVFVETLKNAGRVREHWHQVEFRCREIVDCCGFKFIRDISASQVQAFLGELKRKGWSQKTFNDYLAAIKQFTRWLVMDRRTDDNRLIHLKKGNADLDRRRERRELTAEEIQKLLTAAKHCTDHRYTLKGYQRFMIYCTALGTGLRAGELASITPAHLDLEADPPTIRIEAKDEKARRGDVLPLPADLTKLLRDYIQDIPRNNRLWPGNWKKNGGAGQFLQADLKRAGVEYRDEDGLYADFHALRHTYLSQLGRSGASAKVMQRLARHTTVELTLGRYVHAGMYDLTAAVENLPPLPLGDQPRAEHPALRATGTDGKPADPRISVASSVAPDTAKTCDSVTTGGVQSQNSARWKVVGEKYAHDSASPENKGSRGPLRADDAALQSGGFQPESSGSVHGSGDRRGLQTRCDL